MKKEDLKVKNIKSVEIKYFVYPNPIDTLFLGYQGKELNISQELWDSFLDDLINTIKIADWNKAYKNSDILDGFGWEIIITSKNDGIITFYGVNDYPDNWEAFDDLVELVKEKIEIKKEENY
jgi:hypothetical protein